MVIGQNYGMRKINKTCDLSTNYKKWEAALEQNNQVHPKFISTKIRKDYYQDVKMLLLKCQNGLCAYTEQSLCNRSVLASENWEDGKYIGDNLETKGGTIDHFDENLKSKSKEPNGRKDWLWDNLFFINTDINNLKGTKLVRSILKPDNPHYNSFLLLKYDLKKHTYAPKSGLSEDIFSDIRYMIEVLHLNVVNHLRSNMLDEKLKQIFLEERTWDTVNIIDFPTAFQMIRNEYEGNEFDLIDFF